MRIRETNGTARPQNPDQSKRDKINLFFFFSFNFSAPKLKGRPRRKRKKRSASPGESSNESEASVASTSKSAPASTSLVIPTVGRPPSSVVRRSERKTSAEEKKFITDVQSFMNSRGTPVGKMPLLGYRQSQYLVLTRFPRYFRRRSVARRKVRRFFPNSFVISHILIANRRTAYYCRELTHSRVSFSRNRAIAALIITSRANRLTVLSPFSPQSICSYSTRRCRCSVVTILSAPVASGRPSTTTSAVTRDQPAPRLSRVDITKGEMCFG